MSNPNYGDNYPIFGDNHLGDDPAYSYEYDDDDILEDDEEYFDDVEDESDWLGEIP